jgi:hypothetical protein
MVFIEAPKISMGVSWSRPTTDEAGIPMPLFIAQKRVLPHLLKGRAGF